jgi:hypothetical protein
LRILKGGFSPRFQPSGSLSGRLGACRRADCLASPAKLQSEELSTGTRRGWIRDIFTSVDSAVAREVCSCQILRPDRHRQSEIEFVQLYNQKVTLPLIYGFG